ncbi:cryptococcal mannosyltransferase 1-domain-containing protein [Fennellomyces sp. T-0311]|nr:cryptococcal mannosyltransferase 1-domain-containing protein [Fennellomyces sp. T-0311]
MPSYIRRQRRILLIALVSLLFTAVSLYQYSSLAGPRKQSKQDYRPSIFIAAALHNSEEILENWITQVEHLIAWAGPSRTFVSVYESGSSDKTKDRLMQWDMKLIDIGVHHSIVLDEQTPIGSRTNDRRIVKLASIRNLALAPLEKQTAHYDKILYLNDIVFDVKDAIRLLTTRDGEYDAVCGMDFYGEFYDTFATREEDGHWVGSGNYPYFADEKSQKLLRAGELVPVYSCWNGMVALDSKPFVEDKVRFRAIIPDEPDPPLEASECCLVFTDMRALDYTRIFIDPRVTVTLDTTHSITGMPATSSLCGSRFWPWSTAPPTS